VSETLPYLPGTVLRGALAGRWLRGRRFDALASSEQRRFRELFFGNAVRFGNGTLRPPRPEQSRTELVPLTAMARKGDPHGWRRSGGVGVIDSLTTLLQLRANDADAVAAPLLGYDRLDQRFADLSGRTWSKLELRRRLISRTAINALQGPYAPAAREVAADGQLYSFVALEAGQSFLAELHGPVALLGSLAVSSLDLDPDEVARSADLPATIAQGLLANNLLVSLGHGRSRGLGLARLNPAPRRPPSPPRDQARLVQQLRDFSARAGLAPDAGFFLPVTLESDVILRDRYLLASSSAEPLETLGRYRPLIAGDTPIAMQLFEAVQTVRWIGGWDELRRLPRAPELAVAAGSVWVFQVPPSDLAAAVRWWLDVETEGLGERRSEGFGRVRLLHPLHGEPPKEGW
jgi:CRISPR-associated protein Csx10